MDKANSLHNNIALTDNQKAFFPVLLSEPGLNDFKIFHRTSSILSTVFLNYQN